ncbi:hypothetical protein HDU82_002678 [Entophlyctis luteolus]|nr:hypothetical protein HDU82_002678 [Entophlyctis luteolus]KAJ3389369.1 hypothetical protein HDU84_008818 [Entophlyctis sp. JEL0112]
MPLLTLPPELLALVLSWVPPKRALVLRRVCRAFCAVVSSASFARTNVRRFLAARGPGFYLSNTLVDELFFCFPAHYACVAADCLGALLAQFEDPDLNWSDLTLADVALPHDALARLSCIKSFTVMHTSLTGPLPASVGLLGRLEYLHLKGNRITGSIPDEIGSLVRLKVLILDANQLAGAINPALSRLTNLEELSLAQNKLVGGIPASFGNLKKLEYLNLSDNCLGGSIPPDLGGCSMLKCLLLRNCKLEGSIPNNFDHSFPSLVKADLCGNNFVQFSFESHLFTLQDDVE